MNLKRNQAKKQFVYIYTSTGIYNFMSLTLLTNESSSTLTTYTCISLPKFVENTISEYNRSIGSAA